MMIFELKVTLTKEAALSSKMKLKNPQYTEQCKNRQDHRLKLCTFSQIKCSSARVNTICFGYYASCLICHLISFTSNIPTVLLLKGEEYWKPQQVIKCKSNTEDEDRATGSLNFCITKRWYICYTCTASHLQIHQYQLDNMLKAFWTWCCKQKSLKHLLESDITMQFITSSFTDFSGWVWV
jgi:hypothetical protein